MKKRISILLMALLACGWAQEQNAAKRAPAANAQPAAHSKHLQREPWEKIPIPPLPPFHPQEPKRIELANGMVIFLQVDHELPLIDGTIRIRGGARVEPADKLGLTDIYGDAWRTGGTESETGDQLDDFLEARAAKVETGAGLDSTFLSWSCLKGDFPDVFKIAMEVLKHPAFRQDKIDLAKQQEDTAISRRNDFPGQIAGREAAMLAYGAASPFARIPQYYTVADVTREDLVRWYQRYVVPNNIILGVSGDFDPDAMEQTLRQALDSWPKGEAAQKDPETPITPAKPGIYFVEKNDVNQSNVRLVGLGIERNNPDYFAVTVMNEVLGGGFSGRLMTNLRTKQGLAYDVHGGVGAAFDHPGMFQLVMETKSESTAKALEGLEEQLDDLVKNPATPAELKRAKDTILNSFIFDFDDKEKVLAERMTYEFYGYPADFLERFRAGIEKVTADDVERAAHQYVPPLDRLAVLVVGNSQGFDRKLSTFGKVTDLDIAIPLHPPGSRTESGPAASNPAGEALAGRIAAAIGGTENLSKVKGLKQSMSSLRITPQGELPVQVEQTVVFPDHAYIHMSLGEQEVNTILTPQIGYMTTQQGSMALPENIRDANLQNLRRDLIYVAQHHSDADFIFRSAGTANIEGTTADVLDIRAQGVPLRWYVDDATGRVLAAEFSTLGSDGPVKREVQYSDWRPAGDLVLPYQRTVQENDEVVSRDKVLNIELNPAVDEKLFQVPAAAPTQ